MGQLQNIKSIHNICMNYVLHC